MNIVCVKHGDVAGVCSGCSFAKDDVIKEQKKKIENLEIQINNMEEALKPFRENAIKADPVGSFATMGAVGMMQEEIKRLEGELDKVTHGNLNAQRVAHDLLNLLLKGEAND